MKTASLATTLAGLAVGTCLATAAAAQEKVLRIGMTAADIPRTLGQPDQGFEGNRFTGIPIYDGLTQWDLSKEKEPSGVIPGAATEWKVDDADKTKWMFKLRPGVKFHDGSTLTADAIVWNVQKVLDKAAPHFDPSQVGVTASRMPTLRTARKIDDMTVELTTAEPDAFLPINLTNLFIASPAHWEAKLKAVPASVTDAAERAKQAWAAFAADPSGSGPFRVTRFVSRERLELAKFPDYWDEKRRPKIDKVVLLPLPEANARTAALLSGQVDWIEAPAPDAVPQIKQRGFVLYQNAQPHVWPWQLSFAEGSPWLDSRVRHAANLCVNRTELKELLGGMMAEATGTYEPGHPWYGNPKFQIKYDPAAAKKLMQEAGSLGREAAQGQGADLGIGLGPDAADPDERVHAAGAEGLLLRRRARRHRVEHAVHQLAPRRQGPVGARRERHQRDLRGDGPVLRHGALHLDQDLPAGVEQLGLFRQRRVRQADRRCPHRLRRQGARRGARQAARPHRRGGAVRLGRPRRRPTRHVDQGQGRGAAAELVHRSRHDVDEVTTEGRHPRA